VEDREGAIVGSETAKRFKWKIGDRVPLRAPIYGGTWEFNIRGIYQGTREGDDNTQFWLQAKYLEERRQFGKGQIGWYTVKVENPDDSPRIAKAIDAMYANAPFETKTDSEKAFASSFAKQAGNIEFLIMAVGGVVFFTLLLVTGNTMAISVRERVGELAVLKALGFSDRFLLFLVLGESVLIATVGGVIGLGFCKLLTMSGDPTRGMLQSFVLKPQAILAGVATAIAVGIVAGILPALSAMHLRVVDALRRV
jgi:putative ABC transport system permease protein